MKKERSDKTSKSNWRITRTFSTIWGSTFRVTLEVLCPHFEEHWAQNLFSRRLPWCKRACLRSLTYKNELKCDLKCKELFPCLIKHRAMETLRSEGIAPCIFNHGFTSQLLYLRERNLSIHRTRGWVGPGAGVNCMPLLGIELRFLGRIGLRPSLYLLSYPSS
jgi:hypothetical protein